ncbi:hypothetical protein BCV70DRAFT_111830 [Testicularia cyperi]|uniref:Uncharacterized protein n=1 Tax=Testicularia cyperi TaxID=1882483 RepID=A0A317XN46_9BASI|nr:hypothetical protein BCV70DRAFT_111830 [Testicularia cyperi]
MSDVDKARSIYAEATNQKLALLELLQRHMIDSDKAESLQQIDRQVWLDRLTSIHQQVTAKLEVRRKLFLSIHPGSGLTDECLSSTKASSESMAKHARAYDAEKRLVLKFAKELQTTYTEKSERLAADI